MQLQSVPVGSGSTEPLLWRERTVQTIRRAEHLVRQTRAGLSATGRRSLSAGSPQRFVVEASGDKIRAEERAESRDSVCSKKSRARTAAVTRRSPATFPPPDLREQCSAASSAMASQYMRKVREVEAQLQRQAGRVTEEVTKLQVERGNLERVLQSLRTDLTINKRSRESRSKRPAPTNMEKDSADSLLLWERKELAELKLDLEEVLGNTRTQLQALGESSRQLLACASERAQVLELLPSSGCAGTHSTTDHTFMQTHPNNPFTPKCKQVLESSSLELQQSQQLRQRIRQKLSSATSRQNAAHLSVNNGLLQKVAEAGSLQQSLTLTCAATKQAMSRKQREIKSISYSRGRVQGPETNKDTLTREKLNRPLVQVYQRHALRLPEAARLAQGSAALTRCLTSCEGELAALQGACLQLLDDLHCQRAAAQVDKAILHMRRQQADRRAMPHFLQQGAS